MKVFVSSTYLDLQEHRKKIIEALQNFGEQYKAMEIFGARSEEPKTVSLKEVNDCDILIGIYAHRYGWVPEGDELSITQQEYELAREKGKETLCYIVESDFPWPPKWIDEGEEKKKLEGFKEKIKKETTPDRFTTPESLVPKISGDLARTMIKLGKAKAEDFGLLPHPPMPYFAHTYPLQKNFTGRLKEREQLTNWLNKGPNPMFAYIAIGGMGKSALTWYWLQEDIIKQGLALDGIIWWSFYDKESSFEKFLQSAITYASGGRIDPLTIKSARDQIDALYNLLYQKRFLLVLDGLERVLCAYAGMGSPYQGDEVTEDQRQNFRRCVDPNVGLFLQKMASGYPQTKTLFTSRLYPKELDGIEGCLRKDLASMAPDHAVEFFHRQGVEGTRAEIQEPCELLGYHPLSLRLLSGMIAQDPEDPGNINLWKECCPNPEELKGKEGHKILEVAYNALDEEKQEFVSKLAAFRTPMDYDAIEIFNEIGDKRAFKNVLTELQNRGILFFDKEKQKYDLHPIVRSYCYDRLRYKEGVHSQLRDYFANVPDPEKIESVDDLQPAIELYWHTVGAGRYDEANSLLQNRLVPNPLHFQFGAYSTIIELDNALFEDPPKCEKCLIERPSTQAWLYNSLASSYSVSGQPRRAVPLFEMHNKLRDKAGDKGNLAIGLVNLADYGQLPIGDLGSAESNLRRAIKLSIEVNDLRAIWASNCGLLLVLAHIKSPEFDIIFKDAEKAAIDAPMDQWRSVNWAYRSLHALLMDDPKEALSAAQKALEFAKEWEIEVRRKNARDFIVANWLIGASYVAMGKQIDAEKPLNYAITECRKINLVEIEASISLEIAKLRFLQDKKEETKKLADAALEIANRCGYVLQQADIHLFLAEFYKDNNNIVEAKKQAKLAKLRSHQKIDIVTGDYITKPEDTSDKYVICYNRALNLLLQLDRDAIKKIYPPITIKKIRLHNIKCFDDLELSFLENAKSRQWTLLVGDNGVGKSTLLQCIALCSLGHVEANEVVKTPKKMLKIGEKEGYIKAVFGTKGGPINNQDIESEIVVNLVINEGRREFSFMDKIDNSKVYKRFIDARGDTAFDGWFVAGYGVTRNLFLTDKPPKIAEENLFVNRIESLFDPQKILIDIPSLKRLLQGDTSLFKEMGAPPRLTSKTISHLNELIDKLFPLKSFGDPIGKGNLKTLLEKIPISELSDGYKSMLCWLGHLIMHLLKAVKWDGNIDDIRGIVLLDEIDLHLHPKWQRTIISDLKKALPNIQFIATSHSPTTIGGLDSSIGEIVLLKEVDNKIIAHVDLPSIRGWRADQILASELFDYLIDLDPDIEFIFKRASILAGKEDKLTPEEKDEYETLKTEINEMLIPSGQTLIERDIQSEYFEKMIKRIKELRKEVYGDHDDTD